MDNVKDNLLFMENFFSRSLNGYFDVFGNTYMVDLRLILKDIRYQSDQFISNYENKSDNMLSNILKIILNLGNEYNDYMNNSTYYNQCNELKLDELKEIFDNINNGRIYNQQKYNSIKRLNDISSCLIDLLENKKYFYDIFKDLIKVCLNTNSTLPKTRNTIRLRCIETIFAAYNANLSTDFLQDYLYKIKKAVESQSFRNITDWKEIIEPLSIQDITYYFLIPDLKLQEPIQICDVLFYNPFRSDLLKAYFHVEFSTYDYCLFTQTEQEYFSTKFPEFNPYDNSKCAIPLGEVNYTKDELEKILQSDCHARITIKAETGKSGIEVARNRINDILRALNNYGLLYKYKERKLKNCCYNETVIKYNKSMQMYTDDRKINVSPYLIMRTNQLLKKVIEDNSLDPYINIEKNNNYLTNLFEWFNRAHDAEDPINKYIYLMICLEGIIKFNKKLTIIKEIVGLAKKELIKYLLIETLKDIGNDIYNNTKISDLPDEIQTIYGSVFQNENINICNLINNITIFVKYIHSPVLKNYANQLLILDDYTFSRLEKRLEYTFYRIYNYRSLIMHGNIYDQKFAKQNMQILNIFVSHLLENVIPEGKLIKISDDEYKKWKTKMINLMK